MIKNTKIIKHKIELIGAAIEGMFYKWGPFSVIVCNEPHGWHLSVSHKSRYPIWDEIKACKYAFLPEIDMYMSLPPEGEYINLHPNCFHLWETCKCQRENE